MMSGYKQLEIFLIYLLLFMDINPLLVGRMIE